jgi:hypothetical protein
MINRAVRLIKRRGYVSTGTKVCQVKRIRRRYSKRMAVMVHYDDNLYFLHSMIKNLSGGLALDIDAEHFQNKITEDIFFIDETLDLIAAALKAQEYLIRRGEYLKSLLRAEKSFAEMLTGVIDGELAFSRHLEPFFGRIKIARDEHARNAADIQNLLEKQLARENDGENLISDEEYRILLSDEEPGSEPPEQDTKP